MEEALNLSLDRPLDDDDDDDIDNDDVLYIYLSYISFCCFIFRLHIPLRFTINHKGYTTKQVTFRPP